jgi:hypothetical protein
MQGKLFDINAARAARDEALKTVESNAGEWIDRALSALCMFGGMEVTGEDIRLILVPVVGKPHHHNAWGAMIRTAVTRGILRQTGEWRNMKTHRATSS